MTSIDEVVDCLRDAGVRLDRGLTEADLKRVEQRYGFTFAAEHRALLRTALPLGDRWMNWRHATPAKIRERLDAAPGLVPLYGDDYLVAGPAPSGTEVYRLRNGAAAVHASGLLDYVVRDFS